MIKQSVCEEEQEEKEGDHYIGSYVLFYLFLFEFENKFLFLLWFFRNLGLDFRIRFYELFFFNECVII